MITITLQSKEEVQVLYNLIDLAVKTAGLQAAESGLYFSKLLDNAIIESDKKISEEGQQLKKL